MARCTRCTVSNSNFDTTQDRNCFSGPKSSFQISCSAPSCWRDVRPFPLMLFFFTTRVFKYWCLSCHTPSFVSQSNLQEARRQSTRAKTNNWSTMARCGFFETVIRDPQKQFEHTLCQQLCSKSRILHLVEARIRNEASDAMPSWLGGCLGRLIVTVLRNTCTLRYVSFRDMHTHHAVCAPKEKMRGRVKRNLLDACALFQYPKIVFLKSEFVLPHREKITMGAYRLCWVMRTSCWLTLFRQQAELIGTTWFNALLSIGVRQCIYLHWMFCYEAFAFMSPGNNRTNIRLSVSESRDNIWSIIVFRKTH